MKGILKNSIKEQASDIIEDMYLLSKKEYNEEEFKELMNSKLEQFLDFYNFRIIEYADKLHKEKFGDKN